MRHLKARLENESEPEIRVAAASSLRRHATADDHLAGWWWARYEPTWNWLETASQLGVLGGLKPDVEAKLSQLLATSESDATWAAQLLAVGGYDGSSDDVLGVVKEEANDGAADVLRGVDRTSPVGRILTCATTAMHRPTGTSDGSTGQTSRTRLRGKEKTSILATVVDAIVELRNQPSAAATDADWQQRLLRIAEVWGDGWVLRQALAAVPAGIALGTMALAVQSKHPGLYVALSTEVEARERRNDIDWWHQQLADAGDGFALLHWVFFVLTCAHTPVALALADKLNGAVDKLAPKRYIAIRHAIRGFSKLFGRKLVLHEALRLNQATFSARTLWLAREGATEASVEQIDKRLSSAFEELLTAGIGDLRGPARSVGTKRTIKFDTFRGHRASLPLGGWASNIKIGTLRARLADKILQHPYEWLGDLVQRAIQDVEDRMLAGLAPIAQVAAAENWLGD